MPSINLSIDCVVLGFDEDQKLDKRNFRKNIFKIDVIRKTEEKQKGVSHKPAYMYTYQTEN